MPFNVEFIFNREKKLTEIILNSHMDDKLYSENLATGDGRGRGA